MERPIDDRPPKPSSAWRIVEGVFFGDSPSTKSWKSGIFRRLKTNAFPLGDCPGRSLALKCGHAECKNVWQLLGSEIESDAGQPVHGEV
jgi:hypothetical protein